MAEKKNSLSQFASSELSTQTKRTWAKVGMAASLGTLVATSLLDFNKRTKIRELHMCSGFALVGFCYWHYSLYKTSTAKTGDKA